MVQYLEGVDEFGRERRPPIPQRPAIPERPENDGGGFEDEDDTEEKPMVVVLKEEKHLTEEEAENERRQGADVYGTVMLLAPYSPVIFP